MSNYKHKNNWIYILITKPNLYLFNVLNKTILIGVVLTVIEIFMSYIETNNQTIPTNVHTLSGFVVGLLLVFRTNSAYDRWWEARKIFSELTTNITYFKILNYNNNLKVKDILFNLNYYLFESLKKEKEVSCNMVISLVGDLRREMKLKNDISNLDNKISELINVYNSLQRIKTTPIPKSYTLHIKICTLLYILTLPMGAFFNLGFYSIPFAMVLFFVIAGIEIISTEIENPFRNDPNDLPIDEYKMQIEEIIEKNL